MNNEETIDQYALIEQARLESVRESQINSQKASAKKEGELPWGTFALMFGTALFFDSLGVLINIIPVIGGFVESITITPTFLFLFWIWCSMKGIRLMKGFRGAFTAAMAVVGFLPILNALPTRSAEVIMLKVSMAAEKEVKKIGGK